MPNDVSAILSLPYILPAQAQKHVTHNEALRMLDLLVQLVVTSRQVTTPDPEPEENARYIVPAGATGAFAGQAAKIAFWETGSWVFFDALPGWRAEVLDENRQVVFDGLNWTGPEALAQRFERVGIATDADATNRLAVASAATLLTHDGAGHQLKINKATTNDTASLLFQTGWSGRAEMGTTGSDAFEIKTSANGTAFQTAFRAVPATGKAELPSGLASAGGTAAQPGQGFLGDEDTGIFNPAANQIGLSAGGTQRALLTPTELSLSVPVTGTAVTQSPADTTAGRLMKVGDAGLLGPVVITGGSDTLRARALKSGMWGYNAGSLPQHPEGGLAYAHSMLTMMAPNAMTGAGDRSSYLTGRVTGTASSLRLWWGVDSNVAGEINWAEVITNLRILGGVSQTGGVATGAVIERGSNANGEYVRFADGTQICTQVRTASTGAGTSWSFPAAFAAVPVVTGTAQATVLSCVMLDAAPTATSCTFSTRDKADARRADSVRIQATGRWF